MEQKSIKLKYLFEFGKGLSITKENLSETGIPCVSYGQVHSKYGVILDMSKHVLPFVSESYLDTSSQALIKKGDFVFADTSEDKGGSGNFTCLVSNSSIFAGYHTVIVRPVSKDVFHKYFAYLFDSQNFRAQIQQAVSGIKVFTISQGMLKNATASFPNIDEQVVIANYLDRKTTQIDSIIANKEKLIELLKEKRRSIISEAVSRGIDPSVPMKHSGVDWIGQIPQHWEVKPLFTVAFENKAKNSGNQCANLLSLSYGKIVKKDIDTNFGLLPESFETYQIVEDGYTILRLTDLQNDKRSLRSGFVPEKGIITSAYVGLIPSADVDGLFLFDLLHAYDLMKIFYSLGNGVRQSMNYKDLKRLPILLPPKSEQKLISKHLKNKTTEIDNLISISQHQISRLKEYRQSIISEVVTGKIKVADSEIVATVEQPKAKPYGANIHFKQCVLAAKILDKLCDEPTLGHVKLEKLLFLSEYCAQLDMQTEYVRHAAGPYNPQVLRSIDSQLQKAKWFRYNKNNRGSKYSRLEKSTEYAPYFESNFTQEQRNSIDRILGFLHTWDTEHCEIVATLYGAWNDFLIEGKVPSDDQIVDEVLTHWSEEKKRIDRARWLKALEWMRKNHMVPCGYGSKTKRRKS
ncbi:MAG: restriction endonuclease subunit S [Lacrimispora sp.]|uniref:restriction endonuclease subunit S n=1 Tax=Lacrimispora sp. TaxID=2719234 RepID=UPI0039E28A57